MLPFFTIFGHMVPSQAVMIAIGYVAAVVVALLRRKVYGLSVPEALVGMVFAGVFELAGDTLMYALQDLPNFIALHEATGVGFLDYLINQAGMVFYGGFIGGILSVVVFSALYKIPFWKAMDTFIPTQAIAHGFGRIGCFLGGCCYGIPFEYGVCLPATGMGNTPLFPVQLVEAACVFGLFAAMMYYGRVKREPGRLLSLYLIGYGVIRFILEFFRGDDYRGIYGVFSFSQWISLALIAVGIFLIYRSERKTTGLRAV